MREHGNNCWRGCGPFIGALFSLEGKTAVVTGGAGGIGAEAAKAYYALGANVMLADADMGALDKAKGAFCDGAGEGGGRAECADGGGGGGSGGFSSAGGRIEAHACDVTDSKQVEGLRDAALQKFGRIDVLLNSHGISRRASAADMTERQFDDVVAVNLKGAYLTTAIIGRVMVGQKGGSIVNISSIAAHVCLPNNVNYAAAKGGLEAMTRSFAGEWAKYGVRVNAVAPGPCRTNFTKSLYADPGYVSALTAKIPRGEISEAADLVGPILLLSSGAGANIFGQTLVVDGGFTII